MTELYPLNTGVTGSPGYLIDPEVSASETCFSDILSELRFQTGYIGKQHLETARVKEHPELELGAGATPGRRRHCFDYWYADNSNGGHIQAPPLAGHPGAGAGKSVPARTRGGSRDRVTIPTGWNRSFAPSAPNGGQGKRASSSRQTPSFGDLESGVGEFELAFEAVDPGGRRGHVYVLGSVGGPLHEVSHASRSELSATEHDELIF